MFGAVYWRIKREKYVVPAIPQSVIDKKSEINQYDEASFLVFFHFRDRLISEFLLFDNGYPHGWKTVSFGADMIWVGNSNWLLQGCH